MSFECAILHSHWKQLFYFILFLIKIKSSFSRSMILMITSRMNENWMNEISTENEFWNFEKASSNGILETRGLQRRQNERGTRNQRAFNFKQWVTTMKFESIRRSKLVFLKQMTSGVAPSSQLKVLLDWWK